MINWSKITQRFAAKSEELRMIRSLAEIIVFCVLLAGAFFATESAREREAREWRAAASPVFYRALSTDGQGWWTPELLALLLNPCYAIAPGQGGHRLTNEHCADGKPFHPVVVHVGFTPQ